MNIYYEITQGSDVLVTYDYNGDRVHDFFSSVYNFYTFAHMDFPEAQLVRITDDNFVDLTQQGLI